MSIARHHAEWLSLVPVSGPFLSLPVLMEAFNTGLEPHDPEHVRLLRQEFANWQESFEKRKADPAPHHQPERSGEPELPYHLDQKTGPAR